jgi:hypothetical protein
MVNDIEREKGRLLDEWLRDHGITLDNFQNYTMDKEIQPTKMTETIKLYKLVAGQSTYIATFKYKVVIKVEE